MMSDRQNLSVALLEHNPVQAAQISNWIESDGSYCRSYTSVEEFRLDFRRSTYDLLLLDWISLNDSSGQVILRWIRRKLGSNIPIILLTDRQSKKNIVTALDAGADECLFKPVRAHKLLACVSALVRRSCQLETELLSFPPYEFNVTKRELRQNNEKIDLTPREYALALFLFRNRGKVLTRRYLLKSLWGTTAELDTRTVDMHTSRVRKKLKLLESDRWMISSVYQHGYLLEEEHTHSLTVSRTEVGSSAIGDYNTN